MSKCLAKHEFEGVCFYLISSQAREAKWFRLVPVCGQPRAINTFNFDIINNRTEFS